MEVYYNTRNLPKQDYCIVSHVENNGRWTSKKMMEQAMYPWKNVQPDREIAYYLIEGEDGRKFYVDANTLLMGMMHRTISILNARVEGYRIKYNPNIQFE